MIVVTGAAGFIGSMVAASLNDHGRDDLILVDDFSKKEKERNYVDLKYNALVDRDVFFDWFKENHHDVDFVVHLGARTDTTEFDWNVFQKLNVDYTQTMFCLCSDYHIPLVYASSAATYGNGELGYDDSHDVVEKLNPLNPYGRSKNEVDKWILNRMNQVITKVNKNYDKYELGEVARVIYNFTWDDFASWYVELSKVTFAKENSNKINTCAILNKVSREMPRTVPVPST